MPLTTPKFFEIWNPSKEILVVIIDASIILNELFEPQIKLILKDLPSAFLILVLLFIFRLNKMRK